MSRTAIDDSFRAELSEAAAFAGAKETLIQSEETLFLEKADLV